MNLRKLVGVFGLIVLAISFIVHLLTYQNINLAESYPIVWGLFPVIIIIFAFVIFTLYIKIGNRPGIQVFYKNTFALMPFWTWAILIFFLGYMIFSTVFFGLGLAVPDEVDGKYIINNHGQITEYTLQEVEMMKRNQLRSYSEFWIWLMLFSSLYLLTAKENASKEKKVKNNDSST